MDWRLTLAYTANQFSNTNCLLRCNVFGQHLVEVRVLVTRTTLAASEGLYKQSDSPAHTRVIHRIVDTSYGRLDILTWGLCIG